jgi:hypothetical protein
MLAPDGKVDLKETALAAAVRCIINPCHEAKKENSGLIGGIDECP